MQCVRKFNDENLKKLLIFATGNSEVPETGFKDLQVNGKIKHFTIKKIRTIKNLPKSHKRYKYIFLKIFF